MGSRMGKKADLPAEAAPKHEFGAVLRHQLNEISDLAAAECDVNRLVTAIVAAVASGASLTKSLEAAGRSASWFYEKLDNNQGLSTAYARAKVLRADVHADQVLDIVDDSEIDPAQARNMVDARKWHTSKMNPAVFSERIDLNINKKVDIRGALFEARRRADSLANETEDAQVVDYKEITTD